MSPHSIFCNQQGRRGDRLPYNDSSGSFSLMPKTFFITTAIDYTNSPPHVGHAYEKVLADVIARYQRMKTDAHGNRQKVFFLTGVDQHGQKVQQSAKKAGIAPAEFVKGITQKFVDLWKKLDVKYDAWAATTDPLHKKCVQGILQRLYDEGQIYKDKQAGYYSVRQEQFLTDKERGPDGEFGPEWAQVEFREEENYYFKLSQHKEWLLRHIDNRKDAVIPDFRQVELRNAVERLSGDLCISRPKSRLDWGIELPFDKDFVTYVWFDALTNYISFAGYDPKIDNYEEQPQAFRDRWSKNTLQIIGKDILVPAHGIYWLIMLHAIGFPDDQMPQLLVHGWWNISGAKMSKSLGNIIDPSAGVERLKPKLLLTLQKYNLEQAKKNQEQLSNTQMDLIVDRCGVDAFRYYLVSEIAIGQDADFSENRLVTRYNTYLANSVGNLLNRTLSMTQKYRDRKLSRDEKLPELLKSFAHGEKMDVPELGPVLNQMLHIQHCVGLFRARFEEFDVSFAIHRAIDIAVNGNMNIERTAPWQLAKQVGKAGVLDAALYTFSDSLRVLAILISPVLPRAAHGIFDQLNWKMELSGKEERFSLKDAEWGGLPDGYVVGKPVPLFPRIEIATSA
jgi:methionyl-tRNA synthetase